MPPRSKRGVRSRTEYTFWHAYQLCSGHDFFHRAWGRSPHQELIGEGWEAMGEELLALHTVTYPGTRPWGWWVCEAVERRRRIDGRLHPFDDGSMPEKFRTLWYGRPHMFQSADHFAAVYETQEAYLARLRLLSVDECRALDALDALDALGEEEKGQSRGRIPHCRSTWCKTGGMAPHDHPTPALLDEIPGGILKADPQLATELWQAFSAKWPWRV